MKRILDYILIFMGIKKSIKKLSFNEETLEIFYAIDFKKIELDLLTKMKIILSPLEPNVEDYINTLVKLNRSLKNNEDIKRSDLKTEYLTMNLEVFLLSKDHYYLDEEEFLEWFRGLAIEFLEQVTTLEKSNQLSDFNKRMVSIVVTNLNTIGNSIKSVV